MAAHDRLLVHAGWPRDEPAAVIIAQILGGTVGIGHVQVIEERRAPLAWAIAQADERDVVLVAGKGHEDYQEIGGARLPFSDLVQARAALQQRGIDVMNHKFNDQRHT